MKVLAAMALLVCGCNEGCDGYGYEVAARSANDACAYFECPLAEGAEVLLQGYDYKFATATVDPAELATATVLDEYTVALRGTQVGDGVLALNYQLDDPTVIALPIEVAAVARTAVTTRDRALAQLPAMTPFALYVGSRLDLVAQHFDAANRPLMGHGIEQWFVTGTPLLEVEDNGYNEPALLRSIAPSQLGTVEVGAALAEPPLRFDVVPPHTAVSIGVVTDHVLRDDEAIVMPPHSSRAVSAFGRDATGRVVTGDASLRVEGALLQIDEGPGYVWITAGDEGEADLRITYDGVSRIVHVVVASHTY